MARWVRTPLCTRETLTLALSLILTRTLTFTLYRNPRADLTSLHPNPEQALCSAPQGLGGEAAVRLLRPLSPGRLCCPWPAHLWLTRLLGYTYTGYEVGHVQA